MSNDVTAIVTCMTEGDYPFIKEAVRSVQQQSHPCRVVLAVETSNTVAEDLLAECRREVQIIRMPLKPVGLVRNAAAAGIETSWLAFLDGDDTWHPRKIERQLKFAAQNHLQAVGSRHLLIQEDNRPYFYAFARTMPMPSSLLVRRELFAAEPFQDLARWEDSELWTRYRKMGVARTMKDYLIGYRVRRNSLSTSFSPAKKRKYLLARLASVPAMRPPILLASRLLACVVAPQA